jgi:hypothetical protein
MRELSKAQIKRLKNEFFNASTKLYSVNDLSPETINEIERLNPHETFISNANRLLWDLSWESI